MDGGEAGDVGDTAAAQIRDARQPESGLILCVLIMANWQRYRASGSDSFAPNTATGQR